MVMEIFPFDFSPVLKVGFIYPLYIYTYICYIHYTEKNWSKLSVIFHAEGKILRSRNRHWLLAYLLKCACHTAPPWVQKGRVKRIAVVATMNSLVLQ